MVPVYHLDSSELSLIAQSDLSATEKFMLRITISAWKILCYIAHRLDSTVENLTPEQIRDWLIADAQIRIEQGKDAAFLQWNDDLPDLEFPDQRQDLFTATSLSSQEKFLGRLLVSAPRLLGWIAAKYGVSIAQLTVPQIVSMVQRERSCLQWQN
jgi:hypothetical protein